MEAEAYEPFIPVPRTARLRLPIALERPRRFSVSEPETWPRVHGRLEYFNRRLWFMPPCGDDQQDVAVSVVAALHRWARRTGDYVVGGNEAGLLLDGEARGADAAVWRRASLPARTGGFRTVAPILAVEVGGLDEGEPELREKARWYFAKGVKVVWLVLPKQREVVVLVKGGRARRVRGTARVPPSPHLPGLELAASDCFDQL